MDVSIDAHTRIVALLGDPVEHSLSPLIHNTAFRAQNLNFAYAAFRVGRASVEPAVQGLRALGFAGANVTAPHKQTVMPILDRLSKQADAVGAVNTIVVNDGELVGDNTDVAGFLAPLLEMADQLRGAPMVILGSGGAARAVTYGLLSTFRPATLTLAARTPEKAERLAADLFQFDVEGALQVVPIAEAGAAVRSAGLVVNATPVGTFPQTDTTPWSGVDDFGDHHIVYDLVYNPEVTRLLREAGTRGAATVGGMEMLVGQAAASYAQWTEREMPTEIVRKALTERKKD